VDELFADEQRLSGLVPDTKWALSDHQGTIKDIADFNPTTGQTSVRHRAYDSFGNRKGSALTTDIVFGYTGKYFDETTGMQNNWNRWYSPKMGRFISQDPIGFAGGDANLYRYVGNSSPNGTDPSGLQEGGKTFIGPRTDEDIAWQIKQRLQFSEFHRQQLIWEFESKRATQGLSVEELGYLRVLEYGRIPLHLEASESLVNKILGPGGTLWDGLEAMGAAARTSTKIPRSQGATPSRSALLQQSATIRPNPQKNPTAVSAAPVRGLQGISAAQQSQISGILRKGTSHLGDDVIFQGSRVAGTARATSDLYIAVRVSADDFAALIKKQFGTPNAGSAAERTMLHAIQTGKIQSGEAGLRGLRKQLEKCLGMDVDISIIKRGGPFDNGPTLPLGGN
jgi:RHS repeat-associated protein